MENEGPFRVTNTNFRLKCIGHSPKCWLILPVTGCNLADGET